MACRVPYAQEHAYACKIQHCSDFWSYHMLVAANVLMHADPACMLELVRDSQSGLSVSISIHIVLSTANAGRSPSACEHPGQLQQASRHCSSDTDMDCIAHPDTESEVLLHRHPGHCASQFVEILR